MCLRSLIVAAASVQAARLQLLLYDLSIRPAKAEASGALREYTQTRTACGLPSTACGLLST
eukprot:5420901-Pleurochrysis_carterae.AAC.1